jgi:DNA-binding NarL/FixJ family response regulator
MSISISNVLSSTALTAAESSSAATAARVTQQAISEPEDTVKLTASQQIHQLYQQGQSVSQIADSLSLSVSLVNNYLGITSKAG